MMATAQTISHKSTKVGPNLQTPNTVVEATPETVKVQSKKVVKRKPSQVKKTPVDKPQAEDHLSLGIAYYQGGIYFGGLKTPADFSFVSLDYLHSSESWYDLGLGVGYLFNKSQVTSTNAMVYFGGKYRHQNWTFRGGLQGGLGYYKEVTAVQSAQTFGLVMGSKVQVEYKLSDKYFAGVSYNWQHSMFASSFWGKDVFSDVVLDFTGPQLHIGFSF